MNRITLPLLFWFCSWQMQAQSQFQCGFDDVRKFTQNDSNAAAQWRADLNWWRYWRNTHPGPAYLPTPTGVGLRSACITAKRIIPVAVHVIHNGGAENISQAQIENAIDAMNGHFANVQKAPFPAVNTGIQFVLVRTEWVSSSKTNHKKLVESSALMGLGHGVYSTDTFLNVWVVKTILTPWGHDTGVLGYSTMPGSSFSGGKQGVVVRYNWFGTASFGSPVDALARGDVLSHECGHYLGLLHPFEGGCSGLNSTDCYSSGDLCCDVPAVAGASQTCYGNTCTETYSLAPYGLDPPDQKANFMDYSDPACKTTFTADQTKLMYARLEQYRSSLGLPQYMPQNQPNKCIVAALIDGQTTTCKGDSLIFFTYRYGGANYKWKIFKGSTLQYSFNSSQARFSAAPDTGIYTVTLEVNYNGKTAYDTLHNEVEILDCRKHLASTKGNWYFGHLGGLKFTPNKTFRDIGPSLNNPASNPNINTLEGTMCMSDTSGNLLFYGGPVFDTYANSFQDRDLQIFGKNYKEIQGSPLQSNGSGAQTLLAMPMPDSAGKYYVFHIPWDGPSFYRSVIDPYYVKVHPNGDTAFGRITRRNLKTDLPDSSTLPRRVGEAIAAVPQCNPKNHWLIVHNTYSGYLVVYSVAGDSVVYKSKFFTNPPSSPLWVDVPFITFNKQGNKFAFNKSIYNFNRCDGTISLFKELEPDSLYENWNSAWSANGRILYRTEYKGFYNTEVYNIFQYDIENPASDLGRKLVVPAETERVMQLGPDGKIYIATDRQPYISTLEKPDSVNYGSLNKCDYESVGVVIKKGSTGGTSYNYSMPNLINAEKEMPKKNKFSFMAYRVNCRKIRVEPDLCCASSYKWLWGDGNSSTNRLDSHVYAGNGTYVVKLVVNGTDTASRTVLVGIPAGHLTPLGADTVCSNTEPQEYTGPNFLQYPYYTYRWKVTNGSVVSAMDNRAELNCNTGTVSIKMILTDTRTACTDSGTKTVVVPTTLSNNTIDTAQVACIKTQLTNITGHTLSGAYGSYTYSWYYRVQNTNTWRKIAGAAGSGFSVYQNDTSYQYQRVVKSGPCYYQSNVVGKILLTDLARILARDSGCYKILESKDQNTYGTPVTFQWQQSTDSINFSNISGATKNQLIVNRTVDNKFYRLKITTPNCFLYSNVLKHTTEFTITSQPMDGAACRGIPFTLYTKVSSVSSIHYLWQYQDAGGTWHDMGGYNDDSLKQFVYFTGYQNYRCQVSSGCGTKVTRAAQVGSWSNPKVIAMDADKTVASGTPVRLKGSWDGQRNVCYAVWQVSNNPTGGTWDSIGKTTLDSFTVTPVYTECQQRKYYRIMLRTLCQASGYDYWHSPAVAARPVDVGGYQQPSNHADLWIPDSRRDNGSEPNWIDTQNYTSSLYLWNRNWSDKGQRVWDWKDRVELQTDRDTNFIHVMVYNRGNITSSGGKLYLYWTVMSTNEDWPYSWTGKATHTNTDSGSKKFPLGGRINKSGIDIDQACLSQKGHTGLAPGDSIMITYPWVQHDTVPKPGWYYGKVGSSNRHRYSNRIGMCILARMTTCDAANFGMSYPEKLNDSNTNIKGAKPQFKSNIGYNIVRNNNIVSENFYLGYMHPPFTDTVQTWTLGFAKKLPDDGEDDGNSHTRTMAFTLCADNSTFFSNGEVLVTIPNEFWSLFDAAGKPGYGFVSPGPNQLIVNSACAKIGPVTVSDTFSTLLGFAWRYQGFSSPGTTAINTLFTLKETIDDTITTGMTQYGIKSFQNTGGGGPGGGGPGGGGPGGGGPPIGFQLNTGDAGNVAQRGLIVTPNPFSSYLDIRYTGTPMSKVRMELYNATGTLVKLICDCRADGEGLVIIRTETEDLAAGTYTVRAIENGKILAEKVIHCQ